MTGQRKVVVTIDQMGNAKIDAQNFVGVSCDAATQPIEQALSGAAAVEVRDNKMEYYSQGTEIEQQQTW